MMSVKGAFAGRQLAILLVMAISACKRELATAPASLDAVRLEAVSGRNQMGLPGDEMDPPTVRAIDASGNGVDGVKVTFSITAGGTLEKIQDQTRGGSASPGAWTMGPNPGLNTVVASAPGLNSVTFSAQALDTGPATWYDLVPQSVRLIVSASIALCEDGTFELVTVETSDALPGEWRERQLGKYTLAGSVIVLTFSTGEVEQGTLVDHSLSVVHKKSNWVNYPQEDWKFVKRQERRAPLGDKLIISGLMTQLYQSIVVPQDGVPVTDVEVTVNGTRIPYCCGYSYAGNLPEAVPAGGKLTLKVSAAGRTFEATGEVMPIPAITAPASGSTFASTDLIRLEWSTPVDPDHFEVCLNCYENSIYRETHNVLETERAFVIEPGSLVDYGEGTNVAVIARKTHFLKSATSPDGTADMVFVARSRDVLIFIKQ